MTSRVASSAKNLLRAAYRDSIQKRLYGLRQSQVYRDARDPRLAEVFTELLCQTAPVFIARIGGSDYEVVSSYFNNSRVFRDPQEYERAVERLRTFNGYFDVENRYENFIRFLASMASFYERSDCLMYGGAELIGKFQHNAFLRKDMKLLNHICRGKTVMNYAFIEECIPFLRSFRLWGEGKRILVVSPFSRSVEYQYSRRADLIIDYRFPEFELLTYSTPITYSTLEDSRESLNVTTDNWHQECERMANDIAAQDFDIALLSCGSYAMAVGDVVRFGLGKKALYLGGMLNVMFNIYGERYDTPFFNGLVNVDAKITAFENADISSVRAGRSVQNEALRAYFGSREQDNHKGSECTHPNRLGDAWVHDERSVLGPDR